MLLVPTGLLGIAPALLDNLPLFTSALKLSKSGPLPVGYVGMGSSSRSNVSLA